MQPTVDVLKNRHHKNFENCAGQRSVGESFSRGSCQEVFCEKGVLRNFTKLTGKHQWHHSHKKRKDSLETRGERAVFVK